jgi:hypothetical protein
MSAEKELLEAAAMIIGRDRADILLSRVKDEWAAQTLAKFRVQPKPEPLPKLPSDLLEESARQFRQDLAEALKRR